MAHIHEKIDFCADVFVVYENKVLIRLHEKYKMWFAVGGHIELDEDPTEAAVREVKEEVGLDVVLWDGNKKFTGPQNGDRRDIIPPVGINRHHVTPTHEHVSMFYFATSTTDHVVPENPTDEWKWLTKEELDSLDLLPDIHFYAALALDMLGK